MGRIEADTVVPRFDTMLTLLAGAGFTLGLVDHRGRALELHPERDSLVDRAGRHLPSHLRPIPTPRCGGPIGYGYWWGWHHIAWPYSDDWVPEYTCWQRPPPPQVIDCSRFQLWAAVWDDAT